MRYFAIALASIVSFSLTVRADDAADAKAIVAKANKAIGAKSDDKPVTSTWKDKGTFTGGGFKLAYTGDWAFQGPDKYRFAINAEVDGMKIDFVGVVNGAKAWESSMGKSQEITGEKLDQTLADVYQLHVISLVPLLTDKEFKLTTAGEKDVKGKKTAVVKVTRDKRPTITLYFDKESGLLAKSEMMVKDEFQGWKEVLDEGFYEDYKEVGGRKVFTKMRIIRDGKTMIESTLSDQKNPDKLDAKLFEKP